ncbi:MAG: hypothetical protein M3Z29_15920 [Pseudomonadota bacterium]|nr:hypothetical protein [Pseudomonadota bacterium]
MVAIALDPGLLIDARRGSRPFFYVWMAGIFLLIAFLGFIPTYWARLATGTFNGAPILHIHGALFFTWTLFFLAQTSLVAAGRTPDHRSWGMAGISLATAMACSVVLAAINGIKVADAIGMADQARRFSYVPLSSVVLFAGFLAVAIAAVKRSEMHKRLMLLAMIPLMQAATARIFMTLFAPRDAIGPPPVAVALPPGLLVDGLLIAAMVYDWRTRGRPHPVYLIGGSLLLADQLLSAPISATATWMSIARWVQSLAG